MSTSKARANKGQVRPLPKVGKSWKFPLEPFKPWLWGVFISLLLAILVMPSFHLPAEKLDVGDICSKDIKAPFDFSVEDVATTLARKKEAASKVLDVYDFAPDLRKPADELTTFFASLESFYRQASSSGAKEGGSGEAASKASPGLDKLSSEERWKIFSQGSNLRISLRSFKVLEESPLFYPALRQAVLQALDAVMRRGVVADKELLLAAQGRGIVRRNLKTKAEQVVSRPQQFLDMQQAKEELMRYVRENFAADEELRAVAGELAQLIVRPNLFFNKSETEERKRRARENVKPVFFQIKKGEMIIREGERVKPDQVAKLQALENMRRQDTLITIATGMVFICALVVFLQWKYLRKFQHNLGPRQVQLLVTVLLGSLAVERLFLFIANALSEATPEIPVTAYQYAIPFAAGSMLVALLCDASVAMIFAVVVSLFSGILMKNDFGFFLLSLLGGLAAIYSVVHHKQRTAILRAGLAVSLANALTILPLNLLQSRIADMAVVYECVGGIAGGLICAIIASGMLPILESVFKISTDITLLELSNLNQPVLKRLALEAPGTYHHSVIVGSLAEAAAEAINANPLLARISAFYHDIGKINKSEYFIENQPEGKNKHQNLTPSMSSLILLSHVKDGVELAKKYKLPPLIQDVIEQHHGTSLIRYFYQKAKEQSNGQLSVNEEDYRYGGPKPQTKEIGIIMLADAVEAASRTLSDPTPARIREMVKRITYNIFMDGQLDECELTLKNLDQIAESFVRILTSVFHTRIDYPEVTGKETEKGQPPWRLKSKIIRSV